MRKPKSLSFVEGMTVENEQEKKAQLETYARELGAITDDAGGNYWEIQNRCLVVEKMVLEQERAEREEKRAEREAGLWKINRNIAIYAGVSAAAAWAAVVVAALRSN